MLPSTVYMNYSVIIYLVCLLVYLRLMMALCFFVSLGELFFCYSYGECFHFLYLTTPYLVGGPLNEVKLSIS
ncbi:unnamed protein product [Amoebophrya sp. A25]|nr:unnamed protein product [Amoebophrya sp. A25]|eukprot:GSA25T00009859001.1